MPETLRQLTILLWSLGILILVCSFLPGWQNEDGTILPFRERWVSGIGFEIVAAGLGLIFLGTLICRGYTWVRHALMIAIAAAGLAGFFQSEYNDVPSWLLSGIAVVTIFIGVRYLYFRKDVVAYFNPQSVNPDQTLPL